MRYRQLGKSGLTVSVVGLGCNNFGHRCDLERTRAVVEPALEQGITPLDTADALDELVVEGKVRYAGSSNYAGFRIADAERDLGLLDVAVGGLAAQPAVASVIAGATRPEQVLANVKAADWHPTPDDLAALDAIVPRRLLHPKVIPGAGYEVVGKWSSRKGLG